jgi:hypothetical protein
MSMDTESWRSCDDAGQMLACLDDLPGGISTRKRLLFGLACLRRIEDVLDEPRCLRCLDVIERRADRVVLEGELKEAFAAANQARHERTDGDVGWALASRALAGLAAGELVVVCRFAATAYSERGQSAVLMWESRAAEQARQSDLVREVFGDPFFPGRVATAWRTPDVLALAQTIYDEEAFDRLPILADALEEAGCNDPHVLEHCRGAGGHVKGCWVVDLVLGRS